MKVSKFLFLIIGLVLFCLFSYFSKHPMSVFFRFLGVAYVIIGVIGVYKNINSSNT